MSNTIDQRVVEMRFDNSQFEKNVSTTMSTLDKLKQKLNLSGASKGLEGINTAAKNVNMGGLGSAVETVTAKFSALQVMGVTALANITNSAINTGKQIVKSLTIDPIKSGFSEYELKMGSIQTIMAGTGESLATVNQYLNELNEYSDKTIYSFQDMTSNIGKFTNAGVKLEDAVGAIKGISNEAAVSGASASQASHAMYNLAQALSSGYVKLIDWKSIENAQMATMEFKTQLLETAAAMGTVEKLGDGMYKTVAKGTEFGASKNFNDTLQEQWMTSEVLIETLKKYADETTEIGAKATEAATKVKTFTQLMDTLKESAQSGWAQTWELIVGDFEEARSFFTELSDMFGGILGKSADRRNNLLEEALGSNWDKLTKQINKAGIETRDFEDSIQNVVGEEKLSVLVAEFGSIKKAAEAGAISSEQLNKALESFPKTSVKVADGLEQIKRNLWWGKEGEDVKAVQETLEKLGYDLGDKGVDGIIGKETSAAIKEFQKVSELTADGIVGPDTLKALKEAAKSVDEMTVNVDDSIDSWKELTKAMDKTNGRTLLLESLMNVIKAIHRPLEAVGEAWRDAFSISPDQLYGAIEKLRDFTDGFVMKGVLDQTTWTGLIKNVEKFGISGVHFVGALEKTLEKNGVNVDELKKKYGNLATAFEKGGISIDIIKEALLGFDGITESLLIGGDAAEKVRRTFAGLFAILDVIKTILTGPLKFAFSIFTEVLSALGYSLLDITANIGDSIVGFRDKVDEVISGLSKTIGTDIANWIKSFKETTFFKTCAKWFESAGETISGALDDIITSIEEFSVQPAITKLTEFGSWLSGIASTFFANEDVALVIDSIGNAFSSFIGVFKNFKLPEFNLDNLTLFSKQVSNIENSSSILGLFTDLKNYLTGVVEFNWGTFVNNTLQKFINFYLATGDKIKAAFNACRDIATAVKEFIFGAEQISLDSILNVAERFVKIYLAIKAVQALETIMSPFDNITEALNNFSSSVKWRAIGDAFKGMAIALGALTLCIITLSNIPDMSSALKSAGMLAGLMVVMGVVIGAVSWFVNKFASGISAAQSALSILLFVGSLLLIVQVIKQIDDVNLKDPVGTFGILMTTILALTAGVRMIAAAGQSSFKSVAAILTLMAALKMMLEIVDAYDQYNWSGKGDAILKVAGMLTMLSVAINIASRGVRENASAKGLALTILAMVVSLKILYSVIEQFGGMNTGKMLKGGAAVVALLALMTWMAVEIAGANRGTVLEKGQRSVNNFTGLALALAAVVAAIWVLGKMASNDGTTFIKGFASVAAILAGFTLMLSSLGKSCSGLKIGSIITMLVTMAILIAEVAIVIKVLETVPWQQSIGTAAALAGVLLAMSLVLNIISKTPLDYDGIAKWFTALAALSMVLYALTGVLLITKNVNPASALGSAAALSALLLSMGVTLEILTKHRNRPETIKRWIGAMAGLTLVVAALAVVLWHIRDVNPVNAIGNAIALGVLLAAMAVTIQILSKTSFTKANVLPWVLALAGLGAVAYGLTYVLDAIDEINPVNAIGNVIALGALMVAMAGVLAIINLTKFNWSGLKGIVGFAGVAASLFILVGVLNGMSGVQNAVENAKALGILALALSIALIPLGIVGKFAKAGLMPGVIALAAVSVVLGALVQGLSAITGIETARANAITLAGLAAALSVCVAVLAVAGLSPGAVAGVAELAAMAVVLGLLVWGLSAITGVETAAANTMTLITLLTALTNVVVILSGVGENASSGISALQDLIRVVVQLGALLISVGFLFEHIDSLGGLLDSGLEALKTLAGGLGEAVGAFAAGVSTGLPAIGANLSEFATGLLPFIAVMSLVNESLADKALALAGAVAVFLAADFISGLASLKGMSLADLGTDLSEFGKNANGFLNTMAKVKPETATGMESFCSALNSLISANAKNNWTEIFTFGSGGLNNFGESIATFAEGMKDASIALSEFSDADVENITRGAKAGEALAKLNAALPKEGGLWQGIAGTADIASWGTKISAFADSLVAYSTKVSGKNIDESAITKSATAATAISDLNNAIPKEGGLWRYIAGSTDISSWGTKIVAFAESLVQYSTAVSGKNIDAAAITKSAEAAAALADVNNNIPTSGGLWDIIAGSRDMSTFGSGLESLGKGLAAYATTASEIDDTKIEAIKKSGTAIDELKKVAEKLPTSGGVKGWFGGEKDPVAFGAGLRSMAGGIKAYVNMVTEIGTDTSAIEDTKAVIDKIVEVIGGIPDVAQVDFTNTLVTAIGNLQSICSSINTLSTAGYDFSGIETVKTEITNFVSLFDGIDTGTLTGDFAITLAATNNVVTIANNLSSLNGYTYGGVDTLKGALNSLAEANVDGVVTAFSGKAESMSAAVRTVVNTLTSGLSGSTDKVSGAATDLANAASSGINSKNAEFAAAGITAATSFSTALSGYNAAGAGAILGSNGAAGARGAYFAFRQAGIYVGQGFADGIKAKVQAAIDAANTLGDAAAAEIRRILGIESPSRVFMRIGEYVGEGLVIGINSYSDKVGTATSEMGQGAINGITDSISKISDAINSDIDAQPTIRPVLDLSDVEAGAGTIANLLNGNSSVGMMANAGAISSMMGRRSQNGGGDVVSAINQLRKDLASMPRESYQINGVTYDDGSNIKNFAQEVVRQAKVGRRV